MSDKQHPLWIQVVSRVLACMFICLFTAWGLGTVANWLGVSGEYWTWWKIATVCSLIQQVIDDFVD